MMIGLVETERYEGMLEGQLDCLTAIEAFSLLRAHKCEHGCAGVARAR